MRVLTLRGWIVLVGATIAVAIVTFLGLIQVRHWLQDEQQLHEIVALIQRGQIQIVPGPAAALAQPAGKPVEPPK